MKLENLTIKQVKQGLQDRKFSCQELTLAYLKWIKKRNKDINAFITITENSAMNQAKDIDKKIAKKEKLDLLAGIPIAIKDNILFASEKTTAGSKILSNYQAVYSATAVEKLLEQKAVILGKTNMDEFAMGGSGETSYFGPTKNPHDFERVPGGSSSGSAVAVADNQCVFALGSDTGGSVRQPASFCGIVGLKPTYGLISRFGLIAMASGFDQIGILTKNVEDSALILSELAGEDEFDATSNKAVANYLEKLKQNIKGLKIGIPKEFFIKGMDENIETKVLQAINVMRDLGAQVQEISLPHTKHSLSTYYILMTAEASSNLARYDGVRYGHRAKSGNLEEMYIKTRTDGFGDEVKRRIMLGTYVLSEGYSDMYYKKAQKVRTLIKQDFEQAFKQVDIIATPTTPSTAFKLKEKFDDPLTMYLADIFTVAANVAGLPALSVPCGLVNDLPVGLQLMARHFDEATIFQTAYNYQQAVS